MRGGLEAQANAYYPNASVFAQDSKSVQTVLYYFDDHQPIWYQLPLPEGHFTAELIDP